MDKQAKWLGVRLQNLESLKTMSTCLSRQVAAVLIRNNRIVAEGFNGAPKNVTECTDTGFCYAENTPSGHGLDTCIAVHAEVNCVLNAAREGVSTKGTTMVCTTQPCLNCLKFLVNAGVEVVMYEEAYTIPELQRPIYDRILKDAVIYLEHIDPSSSGVYLK